MRRGSILLILYMGIFARWSFARSSCGPRIRETNGFSFPCQIIYGAEYPEFKRATNPGEGVS